MNFLSWLSPQSLLLCLSAVGVLGGGYLWHRSDLIQQGRESCQAEQRSFESEMLRAQAREISRLIATSKTLQDDTDAKTLLLTEYAARARNAERLRSVQKQQFDTALGGATPESLRRHAQASYDNLERCRGHIDRLGQEAVRGAIAAEALSRNLDDWEAAIPRLVNPVAAP